MRPLVEINEGGRGFNNHVKSRPTSPESENGGAADPTLLFSHNLLDVESLDSQTLVTVVECDAKVELLGALKGK